MTGVFNQLLVQPLYVEQNTTTPGLSVTGDRHIRAQVRCPQKPFVSHSWKVLSPLPSASNFHPPQMHRTELEGKQKRKPRVSKSVRIPTF